MTLAAKLLFFVTSPFPSSFTNVLLKIFFYLFLINLNEDYLTDLTEGKLQAKLMGKVANTFAYGEVKKAVAKTIAYNDYTIEWVEDSDAPSVSPSTRSGKRKGKAYDPESPSKSTKSDGKGKGKGKTYKCSHSSKSSKSKGKGKGYHHGGCPHLKMYNVIVTMRIERYYTTMWEDRAYMSPDAKKMLQDEEYINFFTTCGPNYVRSTQRAQEVTAIFTFLTSQKSNAKAFADSLRLYIHGNQHDDLFKSGSPYDFFTGFQHTHDKTGFDEDLESDAPLDSAMDSEQHHHYIDSEHNHFYDSYVLDSLSIEMFGYGLGLNQMGSDNIVTTSLDTFNEVMKFAYNSMVKSDEKDGQVGKVYGVDVVPWADNAEFLNYAEVNFNRISLPTPRGLIENARRVTASTSPSMLGRSGSNEFTCLSVNSMVDDFGKCCRPDCIVNVMSTNSTNGVTLVKRRCQPYHQVSPAMMKSNLMLNAEFVVLLGRVARDKLSSFSGLGQCASALRTYPSHFDYYYVHSGDKAKYDHAIERSFTVKEMKAAIDPLGDLSILSMVGNEHDEFYEMYYEPCLQSLYGRNIGFDKETDPKYFFAEPWYNHEECTRHQCLEPNMAWDRKNGTGCVPGLMGRRTMESPIPSSTDPFCAIAEDTINGEERCKYEPDETAFERMDFCREFLPQGKDGRGRDVTVSMGYLVNYFCQPQLAVHADEASPSKMDEVDLIADICRSGQLPSQPPSEAPTGTASDSPSLSPSIAPSLSTIPSLAPSEAPTADKCRASDKSKLGNGLCDGGLYNTEECGFDDGDCTAFNLKYGDCEVEFPYLIGNDQCDGSTYNVAECGFDGGDCTAFNDKYTECNVELPYLIGNDKCNGGLYNTAGCNFDGGDCAKFNSLYPNCEAEFPEDVGNRECNPENNNAECLWDGGDCKSPKKSKKDA